MLNHINIAPNSFPKSHVVFTFNIIRINITAIVIISGRVRYIPYLIIVLLNICLSFSLSKYIFGMTKSVTLDPKIIPTMMVMARGFRIASHTIEVSHKNVVSVVSMIGCSLAFHASLIASIFFIHFLILLLVLSKSTIASFTTIHVNAINQIPNINPNDCPVIRSPMSPPNSPIATLNSIITGCV